MNHPDADLDVLWRALDFAHRAHRGQRRKGSRIPYLVHPLRVAETLLRYGYPIPWAVAALLHDTLEDTATSPQSLRAAFGDQVADLVLALSEPEHHSAPWDQRKQHTVTMLRTAPEPVVVIALADKLENLRSIVEDLEAMGEAMWSRFNADKARQAWYYRELAAVFTERLTAPPGSRLARRFADLVQQVFGPPEPSPPAEEARHDPRA